MADTIRSAMWNITDTLAVPVDVLHTDARGRSYVRSATGEKWVLDRDLTYATPGRRPADTEPLRRGGYT